MLTSKSYKVSYLLDEAIIALKKFPLPILYSLVTAMMLINYRQDNHVIYALIIGIPLSTALTIYSSTRKESWAKLLSHLTHPVILAMYFYMETIGDKDRYHLQMFLFALAAHLFVAFSLSVSDSSLMKFWKFNESLFERFLLSFIFSNTVFLGLVISFLTMDFLFAVDVPKEFYSNLWFGTVFIFNTWFFAAGIPLHGDPELEQIEYPKKLKMFLEYLLIPLLTIYFLLLYVYFFQIVFTQELPKGKIGLLVSFASLFGIFALLLGHPLYEHSGKNWFKTFFKGFYIAVIPLVGLTLVGLAYRLNQYGVTESRYLLFAICCWLIGISLYFIFSKTKNIKLIPISLSLFCLLISFGPWSVWNVSFSSQKNRFVNSLEKYNLIKDGKLIKKQDASKVPNEEYYKLIESSSYLLAKDNKEELNHLLDLPRNTKFADSDRLMSHLNIQRIHRYDHNLTFVFNGFTNYRVVKGYDILITSVDVGSSKTLLLYEDFRLIIENGVISISSSKEKAGVVVVNLSDVYQALVKKYPNQVEVKEDDLTFSKEGKLFSVKLAFSNLGQSIILEKPSYTGTFTILFKKK